MTKGDKAPNDGDHESKYGPKLGAKWVFTKALGDDEKWTKKHLVIYGDGMMRLFETDTALELKASFNLKLWSKGDIVESEVSIDEKQWLITMKSDEGDVVFAFDFESECHELMEWILGFVDDDETDKNDYGESKNDDDGINTKNVHP